MRVTRLLLKHFRNHTETSLTFGERINAFLGDNGQGKTNVLEAISFLSLTKSFYALGDATVLQIGSEMFEVEGTIVSDNGVEYAVRVTYHRQGEKTFTINSVKPETQASVIGRFPIVILSPENSAITFGGPAERRKFVDLLLSQIGRAYLENLLEYRRALKQRNKLLADAKYLQTYPPDVIEPWTIAIVEYGARIIFQRQKFVQEFRSEVKKAYHELVCDRGEGGVIEEPDMSYASLAGLKPGATLEEIKALLSDELQQRQAEERRRGTTLVGPHRDDVHLTLNGMSMQQFASQGQHKTMLIALKVAEFHYLKERRQEVPVVLLDDVFSELDERRSRFLLNMASRLGQTFITTTDEAVFRDVIHWNGAHRKFYVNAGTVTSVNG